jgi:hypothetical protein
MTPAAQAGWRRSEDDLHGYQAAHRQVVAWPITQLFRAQSAVMPASLTTFAHNATSALMMSANCWSGALFGSHPAMSSFCCTSAVASAASSALLMRSTTGCGVPCRHHDPEPRRHLRLGKPLLRHGRHVREIFRAAVIDRADDPDGAGLHLRQRLVGRQEGRGDQAAGDIRHHLRIAAIADSGDVDTGQPLEQFEPQMPGRSLARMAVVQRARFRLGQRHILGHVLHRQRRGHDEEIRSPAHLADRDEIAHRVPAQFGVQRRTRGEKCRHQQPCVAVGRRARDFFGGDRAVGAGFGFDDDRGVPLRRHVLGDDAREHVGYAARRIGNDDAHRPVGKVFLRRSCAGCGNKRQPRTYDRADAP